MQQFRSFIKTEEVREAGAESALPMATADVSQTGEQAARVRETRTEAGRPASPATTGALPRVTPRPLPALDPQQHSTHARRRLTVIHAEVRRKKGAVSISRPGRHLSPRLRQTLIISTILVVFGVTLTTVVPLATGQSPFNIPAGLSALLHSVQIGWQNLAQQGSSQSTSQRLPPMRIPRSQLVAIAQQDAANAGIDPTYFVRQINLESGFNPNAVSPGGAEGIAQFEPSTAAGLGINPFDPVQALQAAAQMMARYSHLYGDYAKALAAYNAGPATLQNAENSCGANWLGCMPAQTQNYVHTIMG